MGNRRPLYAALVPTIETIDKPWQRHILAQLPHRYQLIYRTKNLLLLAYQGEAGDVPRAGQQQP
jgi:hypothetical protein